MNPVLESYRTLLLMSGRYRLASRLPPLSVGVSLTTRCNSRCRMCDNWKSRSGKELRIKDITGILESLETLSVDNVNFAANGEIFTHPDIREILKAAADRGFDITLNTNALALSDRDLARFVSREVKPLLISIGLDTTDSDLYEQIRGIPNGFDRVDRAISNLRSFGCGNITIGSVILDTNMESIPGLLDYVKENRLPSLRFTAYQKYFQGDDAIWEKLREPGTNRDLKRMVSDLAHARKRHPALRNSREYLLRIPDFHQSVKYFPFPCLVGYLRMDVDESGEATLCPFIGDSLGNIRETDLASMWFSEKASTLRERMVRGDCPGCWLSCYAEENIRLTFRHGLRSNLEGLTRYMRIKRDHGSV